MPSAVLSDHALARRLERAEAVANAGFVEARVRRAPGFGAAWIEVAGVYAMYDGPRSPCTQTFGLGLFQIPTRADMETLESFFRDRGAPAHHEVSPLAGIEVLSLLHERGYRPIELSSVMFLPLDEQLPSPAVRNRPFQVRLVEPGERDLWARTAVAGWRDSVENFDSVVELMEVVAARQNAACFLVDFEGRPIAAGSLAMHDGVALLAGASTVPEWRRCGAQRALLDARLRYALQAGCDLAMVCAEPGSTSQRNAERHGFRIAYTRIKWALP